MQVIYLIRHGETDFNRDGRVQGDSDSTLSDLGKEQARRIGIRLKNAGIDVAISSPLLRARDTCRLAFDGSLEHVTHEDLREIHLGEWEGRLVTELRKSCPDEVELWYNKPSEVRIAGGESVRKFRNRVTREMGAVRKKYGDRKIAVFTHGGVICAYLTRLLGMKLDDIWRFKIRNGSVTRIVFLEDRPRIDLLGDIHHLEGALSEFPQTFSRTNP